ncbi:hypothetical protein Tco_0708432, partial [Tanacetum coccineum]
GKHGFNEKIVKKNKRVIFVKVGNLGGGGGGGDDGGTRRILGNVALAVGLTYLSLTGQLGWILDTIVNIWVLHCHAVGFALLVSVNLQWKLNVVVKYLYKRWSKNAKLFNTSELLQPSKKIKKTV